MHFCALFPDLFPGAGRDTPISGANLCPQNLLILRCIFSTLCCILPILCPDQPRAMLLILRISASSAFSAWVSSRSCARCPPCQALRDAVALPSGVRGPVLCFHGCHCRISSACRCLRSNVQGVAMLVLQ